MPLDAIARRVVTSLAMFNKPYWIQSVKINPDGSTLVTVEYLNKQTGAVPQATVAGVAAAPRFPAYTAGTISAAASDNSINDSGSAFPAFLPGDKILITGFTGTVGNNQLGVVVSATAAKIVLATPVPLVNDAAGESVTVAQGPFVSATDMEGGVDFYKTVDLLFAGEVTINPAYCKNETYIQRS